MFPSFEIPRSSIINVLRTTLENDKGRWLVEIPSVIIGLYSLKDGKIFEIKANEKSENILIINLATKLDD